MPVYDYLCPHCGPFDALRPMRDAASPAACPGCGQDAPRTLLNAPRLSSMGSEKIMAHTINERARHEPFSTRGRAAAEAGRWQRIGGQRHGSGCGCCSPRTGGTSERTGNRMIPGQRPWMISH